MRRTAALIAGGGPAGSAAAITLARAGLRPLVIERDRLVGDAICGGFVSWRTCEALSALGIDPCALGGEQVTQVRLLTGDRVAEAALPGAAIGVSRRLLDRALSDAALAAGASIERGVAIAAYEQASDGATLRLRDGTRLAAERIILATGKHDLRGLPRPRPKPGEDRMAGVRVRIDAASALRRRLAGTIELHLFGGGYAGLILQEDGTANLCMAVRGSRLAEAGTPAALIERLGREAPLLGDRLGGGSIIAADAIAQVPYGWRARETSAGVYRAGDQAGVISSLAGEGIGIALATGISAALAVARDDSAHRFQRATAARLRAPLRTADMILAMAERPRSARLMIAALSRLPALAGLAARLTRVPAR